MEYLASLKATNEAPEFPESWRVEIPYAPKRTFSHPSQRILRRSQIGVREAFIDIVRLHGFVIFETFQILLDALSRVCIRHGSPAQCLQCTMCGSVRHDEHSNRRCSIRESSVGLWRYVPGIMKLSADASKGVFWVVTPVPNDSEGSEARTNSEQFLYSFQTLGELILSPRLNHLDTCIFAKTMPDQLTEQVHLVPTLDQQEPVAMDAQPLPPRISGLSLWHYRTSRFRSRAPMSVSPVNVAASLCPVFPLQKRW